MLWGSELGVTVVEAAAADDAADAVLCIDLLLVLLVARGCCPCMYEDTSLFGQRR